MNHSHRGLLLSSTVVLMLSCCMPAPKEPGAAASPGDEAKSLWATLCVTCHGNTGKGDGPGAVALNPKPRSFGDLEWQKSVTDDHIAKVIVEGGAAAGKSPLMPPNPTLRSKAAVVAELTKRVRSFSK